MLSQSSYSLIFSSLAGFLACWLLPGSLVEKAFFHLTAKPVTSSKSLIYGAGTTEKPYAVGSLNNTPLEKISSPIDIVITDDPNQIFQTSPPSPVDYAIILKNLKRLNQDSIAIGTPLYWAEPEVMPLRALDQQLDTIPKLITSVPLSRRPTPSPIPPAFRRASIPVSSIRGNPSLLPVVNRIAIPDVLLGSQSSLAGFSILESEPTSKFPPLLAKWDDRVIFSFTLLAALNHLQISPESIEIHLGRHIYLGIRNHYIPIDSYGRLNHFPEALEAIPSLPIPAENLIDAPNAEFASVSFQPVIIRDEPSTQDPATATFSDSLIRTVALLSDPVNSFAIRSYQRLPIITELFFIAALLSLICGIQNYFGGRTSLIPLLSLAPPILIFHFIFVHFSMIWIPTAPALCTLFTACYFSKNKSNKSRPRILRRKNRRSKHLTASDLLKPHDVVRL